MNRTGIEWTDFTWNPVTGCLHGCSYCYARRMANRLRGRCGYPKDEPFRPTFHEDRLGEPLFLSKPSRIFVSSMGDLFGEWVSSEWIREVVEICREADRHTFIFLTKNPARYAEFNFPPNCWLGATVTSGDDWAGYVRYHYRALTDVAARNVFFISWEPMLDYDWYWDYNPKFNWLIMGAMTGPGAKKYAPDPVWIENAVGACRERNIPIFMKDSIAPYWSGDLIREWPEGR
jgi:protein gp37